MLKKVIWTVLLIVSIILPVSAADRNSAEYWIERTPNADRVLLTPADINIINAKIRARGSTVDLLSFPARINGNEIRKRMTKAMQDYGGWEMPTLYVHGRQLTWNEWKAVKDNCAYDEPQGIVAVNYAVTLNRANILLLPETNYWTTARGASNQLQGTAIDPAEAVIVMSMSADKKFAFVQSRNYSGWIDVNSVAFAQRQQWLEFAAPRHYLVVTANKKVVNIDGRRLLFQMGAHIPLVGTSDGKYVVKLPFDDNGQLAGKNVKFNDNGGFNVGALPYTKANIIRQAFKFLGDSYDWGGETDGVDCSSFVSNVYRSVGIELPRDADTQFDIKL